MKRSEVEVGRVYRTRNPFILDRQTRLPVWFLVEVTRFDKGRPGYSGRIVGPLPGSDGENIIWGYTPGTMIGGQVNHLSPA